MSHIVADRVKETSTTTGTGALSLAGAVSGYRAFSAVCANGDTCFYAIAHQSAAEWEIGLGTWATGNSLTRTTILASSNSGSAVSLSAGTKDVFLTAPAVSQLWGQLTPAQITSDQNDYSPTGLEFASVLRLDANQIRAITGLAGGVDGRVIRIVNVGAGADSTLLLRRENASSTAANRFALARDLTLDTGESVTLQYDGAASRWRALTQPTPTGAVARATPRIDTDFLGATGAATLEAHLPFDVALLSSGTQAKVANEANHIGILRFSSSTTTNSGAYVRSAADAILVQGGESFELIFRIGTLTNSTIRFGLIDTANSSDCVDGVYIEIPSTGNAVLKTSSNSTRTTSSTIAALSTATWYRARIEVADDAASAVAYIFDANGDQLGTQTNSANLPTGAGRDTGIGAIATNSGTTAVSLIELDFMSFAKERALIR